MLDLSRLRALDAVAKWGSVNAAASALHCTPSAVSQQLAKLERETGTALSERDGRGVRLTDAGRLLAACSASILHQVEEAEAALAAHHQMVAGRLVIASFATACRALLPAALSTLDTRYPQLRTALTELDPYQAMVALHRGEADVAVVDDWPEARVPRLSGTGSTELGLDVADLVVPAGHELATATSVTVDAIRAQRWIASPPGTICYDWLLRVLPGVEPAYLVGEFETQLTLVAAGLGVALVPRLARPALPAGCVAVEVAPRLARRVVVLWRASSAARPSVKVAVEALREAWAEVAQSPRPLRPSPPRRPSRPGTAPRQR